jgi:resolvase-like protein
MAAVRVGASARHAARTPMSSVPSASAIIHRMPIPRLQQAYSSTSSARSSTDCGIVRPSAFGSLEVDDELELGGLLHRQLPWVCASQDSVDGGRGLAPHSAARGWSALEFVDHGVSGAKASRPALDALLAAARSRKVDILACTKLDRLARSTHHLVTLGKELEALGVDLVVLDQTIDTTTPSGRLLFHVLAAIAEFERDLIRERTSTSS